MLAHNAHKTVIISFQDLVADIVQLCHENYKSIYDKMRDAVRDACWRDLIYSVMDHALHQRFRWCDADPFFFTKFEKQFYEHYGRNYFVEVVAERVYHCLEEICDETINRFIGVKTWNLWFLEWGSELKNTLIFSNHGDYRVHYYMEHVHGQKKHEVSL